MLPLQTSDTGPSQSVLADRDSTQPMPIAEHDWESLGNARLVGAHGRGDFKGRNPVLCGRIEQAWPRVRTSNLSFALD